MIGTAGSRPSSAALVVLLTPDEIADAFDVLATAAQWFQLGTELVVARPAARSRVDRLAAAARAQLARLDPPELLIGIGVWLARYHGTVDTAVDRVTRLWSVETAS